MDQPEDGCRELVVHPGAAAWGQLLHHNHSEQSVSFRRELGLPTARPLIMTGHQAEFWHPGILAKYLAADAAAQALNADVAWLTVDQDVRETTGVRYPARDAEGRLFVRSIEFAAAGSASLGSPHDQTAPFVNEGLKRIERAMKQHITEPTMAARVEASLRDLVLPLLKHLREPASISATALARTALFKSLVERMGREPERASEAYNQADAQHPFAGVRPLLVNHVQDVYELPLWHITGPGERQRVYAEMLGDIPPEQLAPRALFMTGLLRLAGCDLFIHGTGGGGGAGGSSDEEHADKAGSPGGYDRITEAWLSAWLGITPGELAPIAVVTATCYLPLESGEPPTATDVARAVWSAHHARHDPAMLNDAGAAKAKQELILAIQRAARGQHERAELFDQMHSVLDSYREAHRTELLALYDHAKSAQRRVAEQEIAMDRTWPFPLYPATSLEALRERLQKCFKAGK